MGLKEKSQEESVGQMYSFDLIHLALIKGRMVIFGATQISFDRSS
jgi:hypothetical protein